MKVRGEGGKGELRMWRMERGPGPFSDRFSYIPPDRSNLSEIPQVVTERHDLPLSVTACRFTAKQAWNCSKEMVWNFEKTNAFRIAFGAEDKVDLT